MEQNQELNDVLSNSLAGSSIEMECSKNVQSLLLHLYQKLGTVFKQLLSDDVGNLSIKADRFWRVTARLLA